MQRQSTIQLIILATFLPPWTDKMESTASTLPRRLLLLGSPRTQGNEDSNLTIQIRPADAGLEVGGEGGVPLSLRPAFDSHIVRKAGLS